MREGYAVQVLKWGDPILTIEPNMLSGADLSDDDVRAVRDAGEHLMSFAGDPDAVHKCPVCGGEELGCETDCPHYEREPK